MQNRLEQLSRKVMQWGDDRKITINGNVQTQILKLNEEFLKEYFEADDDVEKIKDAIGDSMVVLTMIDGIVNKGNSILKYVDFHETYSIYAHVINGDILSCVCKHIGNLSSIAVRGKQTEQLGQFNSSLIDCYINLMLLALSHGLCPVECFEMAYNEIKDRKGELLPNGAFVKESDLIKD